MLNQKPQMFLIQDQLDGSFIRNEANTNHFRVMNRELATVFEHSKAEELIRGLECYKLIAATSNEIALAGK